MKLHHLLPLALLIASYNSAPGIDDRKRIPIRLWNKC